MQSLHTAKNVGHGYIVKVESVNYNESSASCVAADAVAASSTKGIESRRFGCLGLTSLGMGSGLMICGDWRVGGRGLPSGSKMGGAEAAKVGYIGPVEIGGGFKTGNARFGAGDCAGVAQESALCPMYLVSRGMEALESCLNN